MASWLSLDLCVTSYVLSCGSQFQFTVQKPSVTSLAKTVSTLSQLLCRYLKFFLLECQILEAETSDGS